MKILLLKIRNASVFLVVSHSINENKPETLGLELLGTPLAGASTLALCSAGAWLHSLTVTALPSWTFFQWLYV